MTRDYTPKHQGITNAQPFETVEDAWFWFIQAQQARIDGARIAAGVGMIPRPCEPIDILQALDGIYRNRKLTMEHMLVLRHYGRRMLPPDPRRVKEIRGYRMWNEALAELAPVLEAKKIIKKQGMFAAWLPRNQTNVVSIDMYREAAE
ncbi:MAG: hypothetical protein JWO78_740 [Micavibrio sp.]|nr:hypothetical protein [Micavibrio sp.]